MRFAFTKWQGCGNDFVLADCFQEKIDNYAALAKEVCDRHYGIGKLLHDCYWKRNRCRG